MLKQKLRILQMEVEILKVASVAARFYQTPYVLSDPVHFLCLHCIVMECDLKENLDTQCDVPCYQLDLLSLL